MAGDDVSFVDISATGALVEAIDVSGFAAGALCFLGTLGAEHGQVLVIDAIIVRCMNGRCIGLKFRNIGPNAEKALHQLIERIPCTARSMRAAETLGLRPMRLGNVALLEDCLEEATVCYADAFRYFSMQHVPIFN